MKKACTNNVRRLAVLQNDLYKQMADEENNNPVFETFKELMDLEADGRSLHKKDKAAAAMKGFRANMQSEIFRSGLVLSSLDTGLANR